MPATLASLPGMTAPSWPWSREEGSYYHSKWAASSAHRLPLPLHISESKPTAHAALRQFSLEPDTVLQCASGPVPVQTGTGSWSRGTRLVCITTEAHWPTLVGQAISNRLLFLARSKCFSVRRETRALLLGALSPAPRGHIGRESVAAFDRLQVQNPVSNGLPYMPSTPRLKEQISSKHG